MSSSGGAGVPPTDVLTTAEVLLSSLLSAIALSGSTTAVFVIGPAAAGDVALIVIVAFAPALTAPPVQVTVGAATPQTKRLVPLAVMPVTPAGRVSTTLTSVAL